MQAQELMTGLRVPEIEDLGHFVPLTAVLAYWFATRPRPLTPPAACSTSPRRSRLLTHYHDDARTLYEVFQRGLNIAGDGPCLGSRLPNEPYKWLSYKEVNARAEYLGSGLLHQGCQPNPSQFIGVFAQNRPEWFISEMACYTYSMVVVPLYDTLGPDAIRFIINTAEISTVICDRVEKAQVLLENVERKETPCLKRVILMDTFDPELEQRGRNCGVHIQQQLEVEVLASRCQKSLILHRARDTSAVIPNPSRSLSYIFLVRSFNISLNLKTVIFPNQDDCLISFLPLAHMFERLIESVVYCHGGRIGFYQGDIRLLSDDMKALRPTIFPVVPRLLNRMYDKIFSQANTPVKRWLLNFAAKRKGAEVSRGVIRSDSIWDKIFFSKIQASLGGRLRMIITGAAPTSPNVLGFLRAALGCQVYEAYGQTECTAGCTYTTPGDWTSGHVGAPLPCNLIKLVDVPEKNYFASKGEGEVCVKGPNVFKGYLKDPVRTAETLDPDGWLHTGDIGKWLENGTLKIIDRKKHIFKLAQGEYISPEKIENIYIRCEPVTQLYIHGDILFGGIVVPDPEVMPEWAKKKGMSGSYLELCANPLLKKAILEDLVRLGKASGLHSFEQVKCIYIHTEMFSILNGLLTPTLKAKRPELKEYFKTQIDQLYNSISI
uniref:Arachidonate--CoA ligase n=1 Tax=Neogobius melanostomus TaxID=47308 RepID=A0A8C6TQ22_9GOBI